MSAGCLEGLSEQKDTAAKERQEFNEADQEALYNTTQNAKTEHKKGLGASALIGELGLHCSSRPFQCSLRTFFVHPDAWVMTVNMGSSFRYSVLQALAAWGGCDSTVKQYASSAGKLAVVSGCLLMLQARWQVPSGQVPRSPLMRTRLSLRQQEDEQPHRTQFPPRRRTGPCRQPSCRQACRLLSGGSWSQPSCSR